MKDLGIQKPVLQSIDLNSPSSKNYKSLRKLFWEYLKKLNVPFHDTCCNINDYPPVRYNTTNSSIEYYNGTSWVSLVLGGGSGMRFGIEDNIGIQTRDVDMGNDGSFYLYNANSVYFDTYDGGGGSGAFIDLANFGAVTIASDNETLGYAEIGLSSGNISLSAGEDVNITSNNLGWTSNSGNSYSEIGDGYSDVVFNNGSDSTAFYSYEHGYYFESSKSGVEMYVNLLNDTATTSVFDLTMNGELAPTSQTYCRLKNLTAGNGLEVRTQAKANCNFKDAITIEWDSSEIGNSFISGLYSNINTIGNVPFFDIGISDGLYVPYGGSPSVQSHYITLGSFARGVHNGVGLGLITTDDLVLHGGNYGTSVHFAVDDAPSKEDDSILLLDSTDKTSGKVTWSRKNPVWKKINLDNLDVGTIISTSGDIEIYTLEPKDLIHATQIIVNTPFSGGSVATMTVSVGVAGNLTKYIGNTDIFTGATLAQPSSIMGIESTASTTSIRANFISTGGNVNTVTSGDIDIYLLISSLD